MQLSEFIELVNDKNKVVDFLITHGVLLPEINCGKCNRIVYLNKETLSYRCRKRYLERKAKKRLVSKQCNFMKSARTGTWFARSHLDIATMCKLVANFLLFPHPRIEDTENDLLVSRCTIIYWFKSCQKICVLWAKKHSQQLGGPGHIVEIHEAKISGKHKQECLVKGVLGGYERDTKNIFITQEQDRTEKSLLACIKQWVLPGTTIISECWKTYNCLNSEDFQHLSESHTYNFVDSDADDHTEYVERIWTDVRGNIPYGVRSYHAVEYLAEFLFKRVYIKDELIETFFDVMRELYLPIVVAALKPGSIVKSEEDIN